MGLNEPFASIQGQILLMEPLPSVNKVFSLVTQEEKQQEIYVKSQIFAQESTALLANSSVPVSRFTKQPYRKEKPICTHCVIAYMDSHRDSNSLRTSKGLHIVTLPMFRRQYQFCFFD
jgi:hypothetical protein